MPFQTCFCGRRQDDFYTCCKRVTSRPLYFSRLPVPGSSRAEQATKTIIMEPTRKHAHRLYRYHSTTKKSGACSGEVVVGGGRRAAGTTCHARDQFTADDSFVTSFRRALVDLTSSRVSNHRHRHIIRTMEIAVKKMCHSS